MDWPAVIVTDELPLIVLVVGVMTTDPLPIFAKFSTHPPENDPAVPAWGRVTATPDALLNVTKKFGITPQSEFWTVYVVPV